MATYELPKESRTIVLAAILAFVIALYAVYVHEGRNLIVPFLAFFVSGFLSDMFTGFAHFGFDYVFPERTPVLGPIAREFREHHECPTLDPSNYVENLTKGAYCSLPLSIVVLILVWMMPSGWISFAIVSTVLGMSLWAFFFHQIHSYSHMGTCLSPDDFKTRVEKISCLPNKKQQVEEFDRLFENVPIPPAIRLLQKCHIILNPKKHNIHHVTFETDFSSVNGWSDPVVNTVLRQWARRFKLAEQAAQAKTK